MPGSTPAGVAHEVVGRSESPSVTSGTTRGADPHAPKRGGLDLLFIHHSVGGQLLADRGPLVPAERHCIHRTHPNGGGLRTLLEAQGYVVHEASYSSVIGERTDLLDWPDKFRRHMPRILRTACQNELMAERRNAVVIFKSCYPNNRLESSAWRAALSGRTVLTLRQAKAALLAVREELRKVPDVLFIYFTAPPLNARAVALWNRNRWLERLGAPAAEWRHQRGCVLARELNDWVTSTQGWLAGYEGRNISVFDYFGLLTGSGDRTANFLAFTNGTDDSHPSGAGQELAARSFLPQLERAVRDSGVLAQRAA